MAVSGAPTARGQRPALRVRLRAALRCRAMASRDQRQPGKTPDHRSAPLSLRGRATSAGALAADCRKGLSANGWPAGQLSAHARAAARIAGEFATPETA